MHRPRKVHINYTHAHVPKHKDIIWSPRTSWCVLLCVCVFVYGCVCVCVSVAWIYTASSRISSPSWRHSSCCCDTYVHLCLRYEFFIGFVSLISLQQGVRSDQPRCWFLRACRRGSSGGDEYYIRMLIYCGWEGDAYCGTMLLSCYHIWISTFGIFCTCVYYACNLIVFKKNIFTGKLYFHRYRITRCHILPKRVKGLANSSANFHRISETFVSIQKTELIGIGWNID